MRPRVCVLFCAALLAPVVSAQVGPVTKGSKADLRGATTVYIDTSYDRALQALVVAELAKEVPSLRVLDDPLGADLVLRFNRISSAARRDGNRLDEEARLSEAARKASRPVERVVDTRGARREPQLRSMNAPGPDLGGRVEMMGENVDQPTRYALGVVLRPAGDGTFREIFDFRQPVWSTYDRAARDFVRKFSKEFRRENKVE